MAHASLPEAIAVRVRLPAHPADGTTVTQLKDAVLAANPNQRIAYQRAGMLMLADEYHLNTHGGHTLADLETWVTENHPGVAYTVNTDLQAIQFTEDPGD